MNYQEMLDTWIGLGGAFGVFWGLTLADYVMASRAMARAEQDKILLQRGLNHELASLIGFAFHDPKKMPKPPKKSAAANAEPDPRAVSELLRVQLSALAEKGTP